MRWRSEASQLRTAAELERVSGLRTLVRVPRCEVLGTGPRLLVEQAPGGGFAEALRALDAALVGLRARVVVVSSSGRGDGRSTVAANLAVCAAAAGRRTVLVGGDLRQPGADTLLLPTAEQRPVGLADVLSGDVDVLAALVPEVRPGLGVLPAGPRATRALDRLRSPELGVLLAALDADLVLVDAPAATTVADAAALGAAADGLLLLSVLPWAERQVVAAVVGSLRAAHVPLLGSVVNMAEPASGPYGAGSADYQAADQDGTEPEPEAEPEAACRSGSSPTGGTKRRTVRVQAAVPSGVSGPAARPARAPALPPGPDQRLERRPTGAEAHSGRPGATGRTRSR